MTEYYLDLPDKVVFLVPEDDENDLDELVIGILYGDFYGDEDDRFLEEFEILGQQLADTDFYQGLNKMSVIRRKAVSVIRRKADNKLFGFEWFDDISKHGEPYYEANGDKHGFDYGDYVFLPVEEYEAPLKFFRFTK